MTAAKRQSVWNINSGRTPERIGPLLTARAFDSIDPSYADLHDSGQGRERTSLLKIEDAIHDLVWLERALSKCFSYLDRTGVKLDKAIDALVVGVRQSGESLTVASLGLALKRLLARFGDGHTRVGDLSAFARAGYAPYLLSRTERGVAAFLGDRSGFVSADVPFLKAIDTVALDEWIEAARAYETLGSAHFQRRQAIRNLRYLARLCAELGLPEQSAIELALVNENEKESTQSLRLDMHRPSTYGNWSRSESEALVGDIDYLRIASMASEPAFLHSMMDSMTSSDRRADS
ncbi:MAG: hypothetical protein ACI841_000417 [Planctomycetota bacterium]